MQIIRSIKHMSETAGRLKAAGRSIGFVPTMGALHDGHLSLVRRSRRDNHTTVVSIFVNPAQFGPNEDFNKYPRDFKRDAALCKDERADILFCPEAKQMYPPGFGTYVTVEGLGDSLCGRSRPGHFRGVATVVAKFFNIVRPDTAYFGQKDAQQALIIKKMARDLNMPVEIKVMPIVREGDGLAMSSRNAYLSPRERSEAVVLSEALNLARRLAGSGVTDSREIIRRISGLIKKKKSARIDYIAVVRSDNLKPVGRIKGKCLIALAVWFGGTRLIDSIVVRSS